MYLKHPNTSNYINMTAISIIFKNNFPKLPEDLQNYIIEFIPYPKKEYFYNPKYDHLCNKYLNKNSLKTFLNKIPSEILIKFAIHGSINILYNSSKFNVTETFYEFCLKSAKKDEEKYNLLNIIKDKLKYYITEYYNYFYKKILKNNKYY